MLLLRVRQARGGHKVRPEDLRRGVHKAGPDKQGHYVHTHHGSARGKNHPNLLE